MMENTRVEIRGDLPFEWNRGRKFPCRLLLFPAPWMENHLLLFLHTDDARVSDVGPSGGTESAKSVYPRGGHMWTTLRQVEPADSFIASDSFSLPTSKCKYGRSICTLETNSIHDSNLLYQYRSSPLPSAAKVSSRVSVCRSTNEKEEAFLSEQHEQFASRLSTYF